MKGFRISFYIIFFLFHLAMVALTFDLNKTWKILLNNSELIKYGAIFGLFLYLINMLLIYLERSRFSQKIQSLEYEKNAIKAKLYDLREEEENTEESIKSFGESLKEKKQQNSGKQDQ